MMNEADEEMEIDRIISVATLVTSLIALFLVLKKPAPVAQPQPAAAAAVNANLFRKKCSSWTSPRRRDSLRLKFASIPMR